MFVAGTSSVPSRAWDEIQLALQWIRCDHPDLRTVTCGRPLSVREHPGAHREHVDTIDTPESQEILKGKPICVVASAAGEPPWLRDLIANGCAVVSIVACLDPNSFDAESEDGVIRVPAEGRIIAQTVDSLLIDSIRLSALTVRGHAYVSRLPRPIATARALLHEFHTACTPGLKLRRGDHVEPVKDRSHLDVA